MADITMGGDEWIGLGSSAGRIEFDDEAGTDELNFRDCDVGIGTHSPEVPLQVYKEGSSNTQTIVCALQSPTSHRPVLQFSEQSGAGLSSGMSIEYNGYGTGDNNLININAVGGSPLLSVMNGGNVGIGCTSPNAKMEVTGENGAKALRVTNADGTPVEMFAIEDMNTASHECSAFMSDGRNMFVIPQANTSAKIQEAIDYIEDLGNDGGIVFLPEGDYTVSSTITVKKGVQLVGAGVDATKLQMSSATAAINLVEKGIVRDLHIEKTGTARESGSKGVLVDNGGTDCERFIQRVKISNMEIGVDIQRWSVSVQNCYIIDCDYGVKMEHPTGSSNNNTVIGCRIYDFRTTGIHMRGVTNRAIANDITIPSENHNNGQVGVDIRAPYGTDTCFNNLAHSNHMEGCAIHVRLSADGNKIIGNYFERAGSWSSAFAFSNGADDAGSGNVIFGNTVYDNYSAYTATFEDNILSSKIGIGTTSPATPLEVKSSGTDTDVLRITSSSNTSLIDLSESGAGDAFIDIKDSSGNDKIRLMADGPSWFDGGDVGIGVTSPSTKLDVDGPIAMKTYTDGTRPDADTLEAGTMIWNSQTKKPNFSDGEHWYDAAGGQLDM